MFDTFYARHSLKKEEPLDPSYKPERAIIGKRLLNPESDKLCVLLPGWHNSAKNFPLNHLVKRLAKQGWAVLVYDFHPQILEPDDEVVVASFRHIRQTVNEDLCSLVARRKYKQVHLLSISLGGVALALIADTFKSFTEATIVVGGDDLAMDMWHSLRVEHYRRAFEKLHLGIRQLDHDWKGVAPVNHLKHFRGKPVKMILSTHDKYIRTKYQKRLAERLRENGAAVKVKKSFFGHALTIVRFCLFGKLDSYSTTK